MAKLNKIHGTSSEPHAYVNTKGFNHEEFKRFLRECRGHGEVNGQLSHEEFQHAIKRLCPVSDGDVVCLLRIFDKSKTGQVKYVDFVRFFHERFEDDFQG